MISSQPATSLSQIPKEVKKEVMLMRPSMNDDRAPFEKANGIQSIIINDEIDDGVIVPDHRVITGLQISTKTIHILMNSELKQIVKTSSDLNINCFHIYQRKKKRISLLLYCSDKQIYTLDLSKKEKKRKHKKLDDNSNLVKSFLPFKSVSSEDLIVQDLDWRDYFSLDQGIIIKDISSSDVLMSLENYPTIRQILSVDPETSQHLLGYTKEKKNEGKHMLLVCDDRVLKMMQDESGELVIVSLCQVGKASTNVKCLYYTENNLTPARSDEHQSFSITSGLFKSLFGSEYVLITSCICMMGYIDGSIVCFPSSQHITQRFSQMSCFRKILQMKQPVQNIIPFTISPDSKETRSNSIICVG